MKNNINRLPSRPDLSILSGVKWKTLLKKIIIFIFVVSFTGSLSIFVSYWFHIMENPPLHTGNQQEEQVISITTILSTADSILGLLFCCAAVALGVANTDKIKAFLRILKDILPKRFSHVGYSFDITAYKDCRALIVPVSRPEQPLYLMYHLRPHYIGFIYTDTEQSINAVSKIIHTVKTDKKIIARYKPLGFTPVFFPVKEDIEKSKLKITDKDNPGEVKMRTLELIRHLKKKYDIRNRDILADTTGGTVSMSIGIFQAAEENTISSIYVIGTRKYEGKPGRIVDYANPGDGKVIFTSDNRNRV